jgi:multiple sugar transport system ATP-binding protein
MGRAIVRHPKVFLFDEPLSNLDAKLCVQMRAEIKALHQRLKTTIVYVTHDQIEAMTMADKIVVLNGGRVEQIGAPLELYDRPANIFVAGFMGSPAMNLLPGVVEADAIVVAGVRLPKPAGLQPGRRLIWGLRPEHVTLGTGEPATVEIAEPTGAELHLSVRLGDQRLVAVTRDRLALRPGDTVLVGLHGGNAHLFDAEAGHRI